MVAELDSPPPCSDAHDWLRDEVLPHDAALRNYLRARFGSLDAEEIVQETYLRLLRRAPLRVGNPRAFAFATARNLALTAIRRSRISPILDIPRGLAFQIPDDGPTTSESASDYRRGAYHGGSAFCKWLSPGDQLSERSDLARIRGDALS